jgi:hypothetical protein
VSRTGVDGDHRFYIVDIDPATGKLAYDQAFRDENTGALGVNFNRRDWPGSPGSGFYKPHSMVWVCPAGICPRDGNALPRLAAPAAAKRLGFVSLRNVLAKLASGGKATVKVRRFGSEAIGQVRIVVKDSAGKVVARSRTMRTMTSSPASLTITRNGGKTISRLKRYTVTIAGVNAQGQQVTGSARTLRR